MKKLAATLMLLLSCIFLFSFQAADTSASQMKKATFVVA